ncbi:MAG TPA: glycoside hydrolase family 127 protein, partial [Chloroflexota bacterium]|nr:glycoside hydrolase family 127 protein [Chloroflexota bacterium]
MSASPQPAHKNVVIDLSASPHAKLRSVPVSAVSLGGGYWGDRFRTNAETTIPYEFEMIEEDLFDKFRLAADPAHQPDEPPSPHYRAREANIFRWLEAASFALSHDPDPGLEDLIDRALNIIEPVQDDDGYLHANMAPISLRHLRWSHEDMNELYAAGHLIQGAIAHHRTTGEDRFIKIAVRVADHIHTIFGAGDKEWRPSHPVIEMALVELYRETRDRKYLDLACYFIDHVGTSGMEEIAGHSVVVTFLLCGVIDAYAETGNPAYLETSEKLLRNMVEEKMYVTGALGGRRNGEAMGQPFELPHEHAYAETCAAIGSAMWNWRLLHVDPDARYSDLMELHFYNSVMCGVSLDGKKFFYDNPQSSCGHGYFDPWRVGEMQRGRDYESYRNWIGAPTRQDWFYVDRPEPKHMYRVACCPPNLARTLAELPAYFYSTSKAGVWVHMFNNSTLDWQLEDGTPIAIVQRTEYPWDGRIEIEVKPEQAVEFSVFVRIPGWCRSATATATAAGEALAVTPGEYLEIRRTWQTGDKIVVDLPMPVELLVANPMATETRDSVTVKRGPIVYCFEAIDNPEIDVREASLVLPEEGLPEFEEEYRDD